MNTSLPMNYRTQTASAKRPTLNLTWLQAFIRPVLSLFAAQDDPAALCYMLSKNGETVD